MRDLALALLGAVLIVCGAVGEVRAAEPIKIGFSMELTGPFAVVGKTGLLAFKIWEDEVNAEGRSARSAGQAGLLRRPEQPCAGAGDLHQVDRH
jgi:hypothetical protein